MVMYIFKTQTSYMRLPFDHGDIIYRRVNIFIFNYSLILGIPELRN